MTTKFRLAGYSALIAATLLAACGGGGSDAPSTPAAATSVEGFWTGKSSTGWDVALAVLENGESWGVYTSNGAIYGALQGSTTSSGGTLTGSGREFDLRSGQITSSTYSGTYTAKTKTDIRFPSGVTFAGTYSAAYDQPATVSALTGVYTGSGVSTGAPVQSMAVTISASGALSTPPSLGCSASGSVVPRASGKNIFDLRITFSGTNCALGNGATASGVAYYESGTLLAMGLLPSKTAGFIFTGRK